MRPAHIQSSTICTPKLQGVQSACRLPSGRTLLEYIVESRMAAPALALAIQNIALVKTQQQPERKG